MGYKKVVKKILIVSGSIIAALVLLLVAAISITLCYLTPERLTPIVEREANNYLCGASAQIGRSEVSIWKTFPQVVISVDSVTIVSEVFDILSIEARDSLPTDADTLLKVNKFRVGLNIPSLVRGEISIRDVMLSGLHANVVEYSPELVNYMIVPASDNVEQTDSTTLELPAISINSVEVSDCKKIRYFSKTQQIDCDVDLSAIQLSSLRNGLLQLTADSRISVVYSGDSMLRELPFATNSYINWEAKSPLKLKIDPSDLKIGDILFKYSVSADLESKIIDSMRVSVAPFDILEQLDYGPEKYAMMLNGFKSNMKAAVDLRLLKPFDLNRDSLPSVEINYEIPESYIEGPRHRRIDAVALAGNIYIDADNLNRSMVNVNKALLRGLGVELQGDASVNNALIDPELKCYIHGNANISNLVAMVGLKLPYDVAGNIDADTKVRVRKRDIDAQRYNLLNVSGNMCMRGFKVSNDTMYLYVNDADLNFDSQKRVVKEDGEEISLLGGVFNVDSLKMDYMSESFTLLNCDIKGAANPNMASLDGVHPFIPFGITVNGKAIRYRMMDSSYVACNRASATIKVTAPQYKATKPVVDVNLDARRVSYLSKELRSTLRNPSIYINLSPREMKVKSRMHSNKRNGSITESNDETIDIGIDSVAMNMLRDWQLRGSIKTDYARLITPYFPLANSLSKLNIGFTLDSINILSSRFRSGVSDMSVKGGIYNIRSTLIGKNKRRPLTVELALDADTLDANQLIGAAYAAISYSQRGDSLLRQTLVSDSLALGDDDLIAEKIMENADTAVLAPILPANLDVDIDISARNGYYADMKLSDMKGCMLIHDGVLQINDLSTRSDAGDLKFNALYAARNKENIRAAFDLDMTDVRIDRFIRLMPEIDSIMPLLKEMEGIVDANITASTQVDSLMNVIFPTISAAVKVHGDSLVLLDSETFAYISKMLLFKNKKRNMIDNMDVELLIADNNLELFPFTFEIDRYKVGVMGRNDLDFNLDYHISVLKSPIPFKFGLNISGSPEKMKYRLGKAKYKDGSSAEVRELVETARVNLRTEIKNAFKRGSEAALNSRLNIDKGAVRKYTRIDNSNDELTANDSIQMIKQGLIQVPLPEATEK